MEHNIVFLDRDTIAPDVVVRRPDFPHEWTEYDRTSPEQVAERLKGATIAITNKAPIRAETLEGLPDLKLIAIAATGTDIIDLDACKERGVIVSNIRGYAINTVPEHTFSLILALRRSILAYRNDVAAGRWIEADQFCFFDHPIADLNASRLGIFGEGVIGQSVAGIARGFGMEPVFADHEFVTDEMRAGSTFVSRDELLETSDVITLHCPLLPSTRDMIDLDAFKKMKSSALIINTARGGLIKEDDLAQALRDGLIAGAGIDVVSQEPPAMDHPLMQVQDLPNFILTPHIAWASHEAIQTLSDQMIDHIENFARGEPSNVVGAF